MDTWRPSQSWDCPMSRTYLVLGQQRVFNQVCFRSHVLPCVCRASCAVSVVCWWLESGGLLAFLLLGVLHLLPGDAKALTVLDVQLHLLEDVRDDGRGLL